MPFVVDASVALKWFLADEDDRAGSLALLKSVSDENRPIAPWLWLYEMGNALVVALVRKRISPEQFDEMLRMLGEMPVDIDSADRFDLLHLPRLALKHGLTTYDAAYLDLALRQKLPLATADRKLRKAASDEGVALLSSA